jgi:glycosyltransferase 2 family protein
VAIQKLKILLSYTLFVAMGLGLLFLAFRETEWQKLISDFRIAKIPYLVISAALGYYAYVARGWRWNLMLSAMGHPPRKSWHSIHSIALGYFSNLVIPRSGEVFRCTVMYRAEGLAVNRLLGTVILERLFDFLMLILVFGLGFLTNLSHMKELLSNVQTGSMQIPIWIPTIAILFLLGFIIFLRTLKTNPLVLKIRSFIKGLLEGLRAFQILNKRQKLIFIFQTLQIWTMYFLMVYVVFFALPATAHLGLSDGLFLMIVGGLGMIIPTPGGIGGYHYLVMTGLFFLGVEKNDGLSFATVVHTTQLILTIAAGIIGFFIMGKAAKERKTTE